MVGACLGKEWEWMYCPAGMSDSWLCVCIFQEHLSRIGPEEFVQAFVQKDPLDGTQVNFFFNTLSYLIRKLILR